MFVEEDASSDTAAVSGDAVTAILSAVMQSKIDSGAPIPELTITMLYA
jgi:hypothetical protein